MYDQNVENEANRLYTKFGGLAQEVVKEIKKYDQQNDIYFWNEVLSFLNNKKYDKRTD